MVPMIIGAAGPSMLTRAGTSVASVGDELVDPLVQLLAGVADFADDIGQRLRTTRRCNHRYVSARHLTLLVVARHRVRVGAAAGTQPAGTWSRGDHDG
jgi:hypothetical protein